MRRLASIGVRTPTVYWHVGGRQDILDKLIERRSRTSAGSARTGNTGGADLVAVHGPGGRGAAPPSRDRGVPYGRARRGDLHPCPAEDRPRGRGRRAARREAAFALRTILFQLGGFIVVDFGIADDSSVHGVERWEVADPELRDELSHSIDIDEVFRFSLDAMLARLLPDRACIRASRPLLSPAASVTLSWAAEVSGDGAARRIRRAGT